MRRKRNIYLLVSLFVLTVMTVLLLVSDRWNNDEIDRNMFRRSDLSAIDRIKIRQQSNEIEIAFDGSRWLVNNQLADRNMVEVLFATLQQAEPKRRVSSAMADSIKSLMDKNSIRVELYSDNELKESFRVMGTLNKSQTYYKLDGGEPFLMVIPGYRVYTAGIFELDPLGWKDKLAININWRNFKGLKVEVLGKPEENFEVGLGPQNYFTIINEQAVDTTKLNDFLDAVSYLTVDRYTKSLVVSQDETPAWVISVYDVSDHTARMEIYPIVDSEGMQAVMLQERQPGLIDARKLKKLTRTRSWFLTGK